MITKKTPKKNDKETGTKNQRKKATKTGKEEATKNGIKTKETQKRRQWRKYKEDKTEDK